MPTDRELGKPEPEPKLGREWWRWNAGFAGGLAYAMECAPDWPDGRVEGANGHDGLLGWAPFVWSVMEEFADWLGRRSASEWLGDEIRGDADEIRLRLGGDDD